MALRLDPALETGGDLLWVKQRGSRWIAAVGDVSGKGLAAALYMAQATALIKFATHQDGFCLENVMPALDQTLRNLMGPRDFLTLCLLEWDESGSFRFVRAGHPPPLLVRAGNPPVLTEIQTRGRGLGLRPKAPGIWEIHEARLNPGDWIVLYSDGLTEAMGRQGELFGLERLRDQLLRMWGTGSVRAACEAVYREVSAFETQNRDDRTLFILGRDP
jgi:serine phosphatase RsbU (regulator of sigma subunit)